MANYTPRPPLLPWPPHTWSTRWSNQGRLSTTPIPRTPFLLLKAPASTLYEEKFGGDRNMFTVAMYCARMMARSMRVGCVIDCTSLDLEEFEPLPAARAGGAASKLDRRVRYFHNPSEWDDYDVEYHRLLPPKSDKEDVKEPVTPQVLPQFLEIVSKFLQKSRANNSVNNANNNNMTYIAVFDSRGGLGSASYLIAAYMCQALRAPVHAALEAVKEGSPPQPLPEDGGKGGKKKWGLCDVRLVKDLQRRFRGRREIVIGEKGGEEEEDFGIRIVPSWWWSMEDEDEEEEEENDDANDDGKEGEAKKADDTKKRKRSRGEVVVIPPYDDSSESQIKRPRNDSTTNGNVASTDFSSVFPVLPTQALDPIPKDSPKWIRAVSVLSQLTQPSSSNPQSMATLPLRDEINLSKNETSNSDASTQSIKSNPEGYKLTWLSTKGRRGLLLILSEAIYFIEQPSSSSSTSSSSPSPISVSIATTLRFPTPQNPTKTHHRTLLDVTLVQDKDPRNPNKPTPRFYVEDILCIEGGMVWHKPWEQRWRFLNEGVLLPRKKEEGKQPHLYAKEPIKIRAKEYFPMKKLGFVMKDVCMGVAHEAEGVRVIPVGEYRGKMGEDAGEALVWRRSDGVGDEEFMSTVLN